MAVASATPAIAFNDPVRMMFVFIPYLAPYRAIVLSQSDGHCRDSAGNRETRKPRNASPSPPRMGDFLRQAGYSRRYLSTANRHRPLGWLVTAEPLLARFIN